MKWVYNECFAGGGIRPWTRDWYMNMEPGCIVAAYVSSDFKRCRFGGTLLPFSHPSTDNSFFWWFWWWWWWVILYWTWRLCEWYFVCLYFDSHWSVLWDHSLFLVCSAGIVTFQSKMGNGVWFFTIVYQNRMRSFQKKKKITSGLTKQRASRCCKSCALLKLRHRSQCIIPSSSRRLHTCLSASGIRSWVFPAWMLNIIFTCI
jgi:hypothetical protein